jgi:hypothetical protein
MDDDRSTIDRPRVDAPQAGAELLYMPRRLVSLAVVLALAIGLLALAPARRAEAGPADAARKAAERWLALVDAGAWDASWSEAAPIFRAAVTRADWAKAVSAARGPLGAVKSRVLISAEPATKLPGAPDGDYVVIRYRTRLEHRAEAVETITPMKVGDTWRVSGYYVR